jgi:hypothetical protein
VVYWYGSWLLRQRRKYFMCRSLVNVVEDMVTFPLLVVLIY